MMPRADTMASKAKRQDSLLNNDEDYCCRDLYRCSQAGLKFQNILAPTKLLWLFEEVIPFLTPFIKGSDLLSCRLSCKSWKHAVDHHLENRETGLTSTTAPLQRNRYLASTFSTSHKISEFLEAMEYHTGNPFPGKALRIFFFSPFTEAKLYEQFWTVDVKQLLFQFGSFTHILHLKMNYSIALKTLKQCLEHTPNLRSLSLQGESCSHRRADNERIDFESLKTLAELPYLESLRFESKRRISMQRACNTIPSSIQCSIAGHYAHQLKDLQISLAVGYMAGDGLSSFQSLTALEKLHLTVNTATQLNSIFHHGGNHSKVLSRVTVKIIPLTSTLHLRHYLRPLQIFGECLDQLSIIVDDTECDFFIESKKDFEPLQKLKSLTYICFKGFWIYFAGFLAHAPGTLEYLRLTGSTRKGEDKHMDVDRIAMDLSNEETIASGSFFKVLPKLKELRARIHFSEHVDIYTRETQMGTRQYQSDPEKYQVVQMYDSSIENGNSYKRRLWSCLVASLVVILLITVLWIVVTVEK